MPEVRGWESSNTAESISETSAQKLRLLRPEEFPVGFRTGINMHCQEGIVVWTGLPDLCLWTNVLNVENERLNFLLPCMEIFRSLCSKHKLKSLNYNTESHFIPNTELPRDISQKVPKFLPHICCDDCWSAFVISQVIDLIQDLVCIFNVICQFLIFLHNWHFSSVRSGFWSLLL